MQKKWKILHQTPPSSTEELISILLKNRNVTEPEKFYASSLDLINYQIGDIEQSIERIKKAISNNQKIVVFGDYDADGLCSTTILWETLYALGANAKPYIPHREKEGYGLSQTALENVIAQENPSLIVTVDNGISAAKEIAYAQAKGIEVIVTDHHAAPTELPDCPIIHDHHVCGSAVAYKLAQQLKTALDPDNQKPVPQDHLGLVAIGTICDIIPLTLENRALVKHGLRALQTTQRPAIKALCDIAQIQQSTISTYHLGYVLGPRLNAQGRLDHSMNALRLLCARTPAQAIQLATSINSINNERKFLTKEISEVAMQRARQHNNDKVLIIGDPSWNPGIIGLIASHLVKEFYKPAIVWGSSDEHPDIYKASARSINGFHITDAIRHHKELLLGHGGHPLAAGLSVHKNNLQSFSQQMNQYANQHLNDQLLTPQLIIDTPLPYQQISSELTAQISKLAPFGAEHAEPLFTAENYHIHEAKTVGKQNEHLKLKLSPTPEQKPLEAVFWGKGSLTKELTNTITVAYKLEENTWNGKTNLQMNVVDYRI